MRALLVMQLDYFSYSTYIQEELERRGYAVTKLNDQYPNHIWAKLFGKLGSKQIFASTYKAFQNQLQSTELFDLVLIIRGRSLNRDCISFLKSTLNNTGKLVAYNWDSFRLNKAPLSWIDLTDYYATFDISDANTYQIPLVELFASTYPQQIPNKNIVLSALISNHSHRLAFLDKVLKQIEEDNTFIYIYEKNWVRFCINFCRSPWLYVKYWKQLHFKPLPYTIFLEKLAHSKYTIDFAHPYQTGLTMRCFEAAACEARIITNNQFILQSPQLGKASIIFKEDGNETGFNLKQRIAETKNELPNYPTRTIEHFINDLLN